MVGRQSTACERVQRFDGKVLGFSDAMSDGVVFPLGAFHAAHHKESFRGSPCCACQALDFGPGPSCRTSRTRSPNSSMSDHRNCAQPQTHRPIPHLLARVKDIGRRKLQEDLPGHADEASHGHGFTEFAGNSLQRRVTTIEKSDKNQWYSSTETFLLPCST